MGYVVNDIFPAGVTLPYSGTTAPDGWLLCDGTQKNRTQYKRLFDAISTTYGIGDGSTTFNLPDLRGRAVAGKDDMGGSAANRVTTASSGINGLSLGASGGTQVHTLALAEMPTHTHIQNSHTHTMNPHTHAQSAHTHTTTYVYEIWNSTGGANQTGGDGESSGASSMSSVAPTIFSTTATMQNTVATNQNTGGGGSHLNMQPSIILNYIIKY